MLSNLTQNNELKYTKGFGIAFLVYTGVLRIFYAMISTRWVGNSITFPAFLKPRPAKPGFPPNPMSIMPPGILWARKHSMLSSPILFLFEPWNREYRHRFGCFGPQGLRYRLGLRWDKVRASHVGPKLLETILKNCNEFDSGGPCISKRDTDSIRDLHQARREEKELQIQVARVCQTHIARRLIASLESISWENISASPSQERRSVASQALGPGRGHHRSRFQVPRRLYHSPDSFSLTLSRETLIHYRVDAIQ